MIKVAFDGQLFLKGNKTGIGWCADNLVKRIAQNGDYECQLNYFSRKYSEENLQNLETYRKYGVRFKECRWFNDVWYKLIWPFIGVPYHCFFGTDCEITQFFNYVIPPGVKGKKVTIVHDMAHLACPDTVRIKTKHWLDLTLKQSCRRADAIVTVSEFSKQELIKYLNVPKEKIHVIYNGVDFDLYHPNYSSEQIAVSREKYKIEENYFLYLGTIEPRKNLIALIEAYGRFAAEFDDVPQLVLAGGNGWLYDGIYAAARRLNLDNKIRFTGYIDSQDSPILMKGACAFLFPSLYEGFGMPVAEAMACGTPVLTSNSSSLIEIAEGAAVLVNAKTVDSIYEGIKKLYQEQELREELSAAGIVRSKKFSWEKAAEDLKQIYQNLL